MTFVTDENTETPMTENALRAVERQFILNFILIVIGTIMTIALGGR